MTSSCWCAVWPSHVSCKKCQKCHNVKNVTMSKMSQCQKCQKCHNVKISSSDDHQVMIYGVIAEQANAPSAHCLLVQYQGLYPNIYICVITSLSVHSTPLLRTRHKRHLLVCTRNMWALRRTKQEQTPTTRLPIFKKNTSKVKVRRPNSQRSLPTTKIWITWLQISWPATVWSSQ